ncbi:16S rRNA processing protein rimM [Spiroplasma chinense]|uniref:Ribosome maturation factor RimM n=2 Tax=Spiroplasma chinense TaxID=216932 RepID=A0A5B9Y4H0_9MOLU|nr:16S rRNA processing protein rimM [Spiroplasma chinense]
MDLNKQLTEVGKLASTHGIKGEFKFWLNTEFYLVDELVGKQLFLKDNKNNFDVYTIERFYTLKNKLIVKLEGIDNVNDAQKYVQQIVLFKNDDNLVEKEISLLDYKILFEEKNFGKVIELMNNGVYDLVKVKSTDNKEFWIPCVDEYVQEYDDENMILKVKNIEGLM